MSIDRRVLKLCVILSSSSAYTNVEDISNVFMKEKNDAEWKKAAEQNVLLAIFIKINPYAHMGVHTRLDL